MRMYVRFYRYTTDGFLESYHAIYTLYTSVYSIVFYEHTRAYAYVCLLGAPKRSDRYICLIAAQIKR